MTHQGDSSSDVAGASRRPTALSTLLARPERFPDELERGYILRLAHANGLLNPEWVRDIEGYRRVPTGVVHVRWCPICLATENAYWKQAWGSGIPICLRHQIWLLDRCGPCGKRMTWRNVRFRTCSCGESLAEGDSAELPNGVAQLFAGDFIHTDDSPWWACLLEQRRWRVAQFLGALYKYGLHGKPIKKASTSDLAVERELVNAGAEILLKSAAGMRLLLDRIRVTPDRSMAAQTIHEAFPGLLVRMRKLLHRYEFDALIAQVNAYLAMHSVLDVPIVWRGHAVKPTIGATTFARALGVRPEQVAHLLAAYGIDVKARQSATGRRMLAIAPKVVEDVRTSRLAAFTAKVAAKKFGLSPARQDLLAQAGLISKIGKKIDGRTVRILLADLAPTKAIRALTKPVHFVGLDIALRTLVPVEYSVAFFRAILEGKITSWRSREICEHVKDIEICHEEATPVLSATKHLSEPLLGIPEAALQLGLKEEVAYHLVNRGLIKSVVRKEGRRPARFISEREIARFSLRYETLVSAAERNEISRQGALKWARALDISIVSGPSVDGGRQYFVSKPIVGPVR